MHPGAPNTCNGSHSSDALQAAALAAFGHKERFPQPGGLAVVAEEGDASARPELVDTGTPGRLRETSSLSTQDILWPTQSLGGSILHRQQSAGGSVLSLPASSGPSPIASQVDSLTVHPETRLFLLDTQLGVDCCLHLTVAIVYDSICSADGLYVRCCSAQGLRTGGGSGAFSPVHPTPKDSLGAAAAANAAFASSPRALIREPPFSGQLTGPGGKGSSSMFVGPSRPRSAAARALLAGTTLHPVVQLGWQPLCEVHCNGCAPCMVLFVASIVQLQRRFPCWMTPELPGTRVRTTCNVGL